MKKQADTRHGAILLLILILGAGCSPQEICDESLDSVVVIRFKQGYPEALSDTTLAGITVLGIRGDNQYGLLVNNGSVFRMELPLNPAHPESSYILQIGEIQDTLVVKHSSESYLLSEACGFAMRFTLNDLSYTGENIRGDSLLNRVIDAENESEEEDIWLFF